MLVASMPTENMTGSQNSKKKSSVVEEANMIIEGWKSRKSELE